MCWCQQNHSAVFKIIMGQVADWIAMVKILHAPEQNSLLKQNLPRLSCFKSLSLILNFKITHLTVTGKYMVINHHFGVQTRTLFSRTFRVQMRNNQWQICVYCVSSVDTQLWGPGQPQRCRSVCSDQTSQRCHPESHPTATMKRGTA